MGRWAAVQAEGASERMRIKSGQDLATGLMFVLIGASGLWFGADYAMGTAQRPGTGVLPYILSWCLIATGGLLWLKATLVKGPPLTGWAWRPVIGFVPLVMGVFGIAEIMSNLTNAERRDLLSSKVSGLMCAAPCCFRAVTPWCSYSGRCRLPSC